MLVRAVIMSSLFSGLEKRKRSEGLELCERHAGLDTRKSVADSEAHKQRG